MEKLISIHALLAESDNAMQMQQANCCCISIHALLAESDWIVWRVSQACVDFYPRSPCGERQFESIVRCYVAIFLSTLSLRRATTQSIANLDDIMISIHALLAESDFCNFAKQRPSIYFYPRSPCGERLLELAKKCYQGAISIHALLAESDMTLTQRFFA